MQAMLISPKKASIEQKTPWEVICLWNDYAFQNKRSSVAQKLFSGRAFTCNQNLLPSI
ncbi:hypothetical protein BSM4216_0689 [Bacillus smithii]|nr:hypothetical protein BSM4216_0689 [Bacillus smithii]